MLNAASKVVIGIITKEQFFEFMQCAHEAMWKLPWSEDMPHCELLTQFFSNFVLLISGMDEELAHYFTDYLSEHKELNVDQLDMLFDYLSSETELIQN